MCRVAMQFPGFWSLRRKKNELRISSVSCSRSFFSPRFDIFPGKTNRSAFDTFRVIQRSAIRSIRFRIQCGEMTSAFLVRKMCCPRSHKFAQLSERNRLHESALSQFQMTTPNKTISEHSKALRTAFLPSVTFGRRRRKTIAIETRDARFFVVQHTKTGKMYQITIRYTKWPQNIPNGYKMHTLFFCKTLQNLPKSGVFGLKI
jgi:hypothetical protein